MSRFKNIQVAERRVQKLLGSIDRKIGLTDGNTYLQNSISAQTLLKLIGFQVKHY